MFTRRLTNTATSEIKPGSLTSFSTSACTKVSDCDQRFKLWWAARPRLHRESTLWLLSPQTRTRKSQMPSTAAQNPDVKTPQRVSSTRVLDMLLIPSHRAVTMGKLFIAGPVSSSTAYFSWIQRSLPFRAWYRSALCCYQRAYYYEQYHSLCLPKHAGLLHLLPSLYVGQS